MGVCFLDSAVEVNSTFVQRACLYVWRWQDKDVKVRKGVIRIMDNKKGHGLSYFSKLMTDAPALSRDSEKDVYVIVGARTRMNPETEYENAGGYEWVGALRWFT